MFKTLFGIVKFLIGFVIALTLVVAGGMASARYFITQMTNPPPKPIFPNDRQTSSTENSTRPRRSGTTSSSESLPPGAYEARVTWPEGLILRDRPSYDAVRIGGIAYNGRVIILGESSDKVWQQVRLEYSSQEGWIKGGNTTAIN